MALLSWIESTSLSVWARESTSVWAFPALLSAHAIGMAFAAGISVAIALHVLGVGPAIPTREWRRFLGILWAGFWLNAGSGILLLAAYPTKALTNPVFYLKLLLIAVAMRVLVTIQGELGRDPMGPVSAAPDTIRRLAIVSIASWAGAITAGRLLAYTYRHLLVGF